MKTRHISNRNNQENLQILCNGCVTPVNAYRALVVDAKNLKPRKVFSTTHIKPVSQQATWQYLKDGDLVFLVEREFRNSPMTKKVLNYVNDEFQQLDEDTVNEKWATLSEEISGWLTDMVYSELNQASESFLPAGCGWDGKNTEMTDKKKERMTLMLSRLPNPQRARYIEEAMSSPWQGLPEWNAAKPLPQQIKNSTLDFYRDQCNEECTVSWIIWHEGNWSEYLTYCKQTEQWYSTSEKSKLNGTKGPSIQIPKTVIKAMKIFHHPYSTRKQEYMGLSWLLFRDGKYVPKNGRKVTDSKTST